jgi:uncharacterized protein YdaU (DUF1376 family)
VASEQNQPLDLGRCVQRRICSSAACRLQTHLARSCVLRRPWNFAVIEDDVMSGNHFYAWFPGDYARDTAHLSMVEDAAYRRLLDAYYMSGKVSANANILLRVCRAINDEEKAAVLHVVDEFFEVIDDQIYHEKVEHELARSRAITEKRSNAGKLGAAKTNGKKSANAAASDDDLPKILPSKSQQTTRQPIPTYSVSKDTGAAAPFSPSATVPADPKKHLFDLGISILTNAGDSDKNARSFLAKFAKQNEEKLGEVLGYLAANSKVEPKSYIVAAFKPKERRLAL